MAAITGDFTIVRGDTWTETWVFSVGGVATDITGGKIYFTMKNAVTDADPGVLQLTSPSSGITIDSAAAGQCTFTITPAQSELFAPATYYYDIQYKDSAGNRQTYGPYRLTVIADITISAA